MSTKTSPRPRFYPPCFVVCSAAFSVVFSQDSSSSNPCQGLGLCSAVLLGPFLHWSARWWLCFARSRIHVSSQRGWWCQRPGVLCNCCFLCLSSSCGCLVFLQTHLQCPLCFPDVLLPTTAGDLLNHSRCFQCGVSVLDPAQFLPESGWGPKDSSNCRAAWA